ncbi:MAG: trypsin-like peptidase domain-containing protein [Leptospiraceae bacterium]|nr:trypsin-like peptidase domain-containing protein [Leptospiraceae bacterium]
MKYILTYLFLFLSSSLFSQQITDFDMIRKGVVQIRTYSQGLDAFSPWLTTNVRASGGTGFIIDKDKIMTNAHVISNAKYIQVQRHNQTVWYEVDILFVAHDCDLAILKAKDPSFYDDATSFEFGAIPDLNSSITVVGYPIGGDKISVSRGIVSRKEQSTYAHSEVDSHLVIQVDAAINPGNSGGPAIQDNKVVGVAFQVASRGENIGYLIPTTVIRYFLKDIEDGKYDGYVELGIRTLNSFNNTLREYKKIPKDLNGVFVTKVLKGGSADGFLKKDDLLLEIDGLPIGRNGTIVLDKDARIDFVEIVDNKHSGDIISFRVFRDKQLITVNFPAKRMDEFTYMRHKYDEPFDYFTIGGLVFQSISRDLLQEWSKNNETQGGSQFLYRFFYFIDDDLCRDVESDIVLYRKLAHPINTNSDYFLNMVIESVNDVKIQNLKQFKELVMKKDFKFLKLKFRDIDVPLILKKEDIEKADKEIQSIYKVGNK